MTTLTDYALSATGVYLGVRLLRVARARGVTSSALWAAAFLCGGIAALVGGSSHGLGAHIGRGLHDALWLITYYLVGVVSLLILAGAFAAFLPRRWRPWLVALLLLRLLVTAALLTIHRDFRYLIPDYSITILVICGLLLHARWTRRDPSAPWALAALGISFVGVIIQNGRIAPHAAFNHNDLFHLTAIAALYLFYRGGLLLGDRP